MLRKLIILFTFFASLESAAMDRIRKTGQNPDAPQIEIPSSTGIKTQWPELYATAIRTLYASDAMETPLDVARAAAAQNLGWPSPDTPPEEEQKAVARTLLREHLHRSTTRFEIVRDGEDEQGFLPEGGEDLGSNTVFSLLVPSLSDHIYWVVIPKDHAQAAYVYGFN